MKYDDRNAAAILTLHPAVQHKAWQGLEELAYIAEDALIASPFRTEAEQADDYASGRTRKGPIVTNAKPGWSFHNYGLAIDLVPVGPLGIPLTKRNLLEWAAISRYQVYGSVLQQVGFEWGYQIWGFDRPHFQYTTDAAGRHLTIEQVRAGARPDVTRAMLERRAALQERIDLAQRALSASYVAAKRKDHLAAFVATMTARLAEIR